MIISFILNGETVSVQAPPEKRLIALLREDLGLKGAKAGCLKGQCGSCTVLLNGSPVPSCLVPAFAVRDGEVVTAEGLAMTEDFGDIVQGFTRAGVNPCGYCAGATSLTVHALLESIPRPSDAEIREALSGIHCRCLHYRGLIRGIKIAAQLRLRRLGRRRRA